MLYVFQHLKNITSSSTNLKNKEHNTFEEEQNRTILKHNYILTQTYSNIYKSKIKN